MDTVKKVVVIGGGITGLSTMYYLQNWKRQHGLEIELLLIEKNNLLGVKNRTVYHNGFKIETGADSNVANKKDVLPLLEDLQLNDDIVYNATGTSFIYTDHQLHKMPDGCVYGIPTSIAALNNSALVSKQGKEAALKDLDSENIRFTKEDSIGEFLECFLGKEMVEKQISPILSGVYSGNLYDLSIASTLPYLLDYKNEYGSIIRGLAANPLQANKNNKKFISFKNGLKTLIDQLESKLTDVTILKGVQTSSVQKEKHGYAITCENYDTIQADTIVLSIPHNAAQQLLNDEKLDQNFNRLKNSSLISIYLGFDLPDSKLPTDGTGFIVSSEDTDLLCNACTWTSRKWPNTSTDGKLLTRLFYKSSIPSYEQLNNMNENELLKVAMMDIEKSLGLKDMPISVEVTKWTNLMPNYTIEHPECIRLLNMDLEKTYPNVHLAGCSYYGVGIGACITNGKNLAERLAKNLFVFA